MEIFSTKARSKGVLKIFVFLCYCIVYCLDFAIVFTVQA